MKTGLGGTFIISWSQTEVNGLEAAPVNALTVGSEWCWRGDAIRADQAMGLCRRDVSDPKELSREHAAAQISRLVRAALDPCHAPAMLCASPKAKTADNWFVVTDGVKRYTATLIHIGQGIQPLLMFLGELPPRHAGLWVADHSLGPCPQPTVQSDAAGVICFTPGTRISTPRGPVLVEHLRVGDLVQTKDNGAQPIEWIGQRHMTAARLFAMPHLRPIRIRMGAFGIRRPEQELLVSPEHRLLVTGPVAREMFATPEVLISAKDIVDGELVTPDERAQDVTYIHLLLPGHNILWANGVETESFHPANTALDSINESDRKGLLALYPTLMQDAFTYGAHIRRNLSTPEAVKLIGAA